MELLSRHRVDVFDVCNGNGLDRGALLDGRSMASIGLRVRVDKGLLREWNTLALGFGLWDEALLGLGTLAAA